MTTTVHQALAKVMGAVHAVKKDSRNQQQGFNFRGIDAVMNAVGPALRENGVIVMPTIENIEYRDVDVGKNKTPMRECMVRVRYTFHGPEGDMLDATVCGEALDSGDKATAKAFSVAYRTCLLQALTIPTDEPDPDESSHQRAPKTTSPRTSPGAGAEPLKAEAASTPGDPALEAEALALAADLAIPAADVMKSVRQRGWPETVSRLKQLKEERAKEAS